MAIKVLIKRHVREGHLQEAIGILENLRGMAINQPGYISGETLTNHYDPRTIVVVSAWHTLEDWIRWQSSDERSGSEAYIETILEEPTKYEVYDVRSAIVNVRAEDALIQPDEVS